MPSRFGPDALPAVVALDLDGTLLTSDKQVTPRARAAIRQLATRRVRVVLCTGRPPRSALPYARELGLEHPFVCFNGAALFHPVRGEVHVRRYLDATLARSAVGRLRAAYPHVMVGLETDRGWFLDPALYRQRSSEVRLGPEEPTGVGPVERFLGPGTIKLFARADGVGAAELARPVEALPLNRTWSNPQLLELLDPRANKRSALDELCRELGITPSQVAAFGDQRNDVEMIAWAGLGVAVANAEPLALQAADVVAAGNDADGVALTIEAWLRADPAHRPHPASTSGE